MQSVGKPADRIDPDAVLTRDFVVRALADQVLKNRGPLRQHHYFGGGKQMLKVRHALDRGKDVDVLPKPFYQLAFILYGFARNFWQFNSPPNNIYNIRYITFNSSDTILL
jgi:hypothetical protein